MSAPPRLLERVVAASLAPEERAVVLGDLHEEFTGIQSRAGRRAAIRWYCRQTVTSLGPNLVRRARIARRRRAAGAEAGRRNWRSVLAYTLVAAAFGVAPPLTSMLFPGTDQLDVALWAAPFMGLGIGYVIRLFNPRSAAEPSSQSRARARIFALFCLSRLPFIFVHAQFPRFVRAFDAVSLLVLVALSYWLTRSRNSAIR